MVVNPTAATIAITQPMALLIGMRDRVVRQQEVIAVRQLEGTVGQVDLPPPERQLRLPLVDRVEMVGMWT